MTRRPSKEVAELRDGLKADLRGLGKHWIAELAKEAGVPQRSLRTVFLRGQEMPRYREQLEAAARRLRGADEDETVPGAPDRIAGLLGQILARLAPLDKLADLPGQLDTLKERLSPLVGVPGQLDDLRKEIRSLKEPHNRRADGGASATAP